LHPDKEIFRPIGKSLEIGPIPITEQMLISSHFVRYGENVESAEMLEYTDGRIIIRVTKKEDLFTIFTPIDMPWATPNFPIQTYYITGIYFVHQLQNIYFDFWGGSSNSPGRLRKRNELLLHKTCRL
jgi:hypothetical protein